MRVITAQQVRRVIHKSWQCRKLVFGLTKQFSHLWWLNCLSQMIDLESINLCLIRQFLAGGCRQMPGNQHDSLTIGWR